MKAFGYAHFEELPLRHARLRRRKAIPSELRRRVRKAVVLSRVSAGADIAITSIIVQRLLAALPKAELVLIGPEHLQEFFGEMPRLRWLRLRYPRQGPLMERAMIWPQVVDLVYGEINDVPEDDLLVFDPDTRLTQLGLLPVAPEQRTCYFSSRTNPFKRREPSLSELTNQWLTELFAEGSALPPAVFLPRDKKAAAEVFCRGLRQQGADSLAVFNFGVGHNPEKRIEDPFEEELLAAILTAERKTIILLDSGGDSDEKRKVLFLLSALKDRGFSTDYVEEEEVARKKLPFPHGVIGFQGSLGMLGALISQAGFFFGYDSCGQHLAAALRTPAAIVFAGAPNPRFAARWRPSAPSTSVLPVSNGAGLNPQERRELVARVLELYREKKRVI